jgi:hypothetical protein
VIPAVHILPLLSIVDTGVNESLALMSIDVSDHIDAGAWSIDKLSTPRRREIRFSATLGGISNRTG